jgi:hypothetical protein
MRPHSGKKEGGWGGPRFSRRRTSGEPGTTDLLQTDAVLTSRDIVMSGGLRRNGIQVPYRGSLVTQIEGKNVVTSNDKTAFRVITVMLFTIAMHSIIFA